MPQKIQRFQKRIRFPFVWKFNILLSKCENKFDLLRNNIALCSPSPDIIVFAETWLNKNVCDAELGLKQYTVYRPDRSDNDNQSFMRGGGTLIAIRSCFLSERCSVSP